MTKDPMASADFAGPGSQGCAPEPAAQSPPAVPIPIAYETMVFKFASEKARSGFFAKYFPGNPFAGELLPGVTVAAMSLSNVIGISDVYEDALEAIAFGERSPDEIAQRALDRAEADFWADAQGIEAGTAEPPAAAPCGAREPGPAEQDAPQLSPEQRHSLVTEQFRAALRHEEDRHGG